MNRQPSQIILLEGFGESYNSFREHEPGGESGRRESRELVSQ